MKSNVFNVRSKIPELDQACNAFRGGELIAISRTDKKRQELACANVDKKFLRSEYDQSLVLV